jgi:hypothetical protein
MGENFSCLGGNEPVQKNGIDIKVFTPKNELENDSILVNENEAVSIQSAARGYIDRKKIKKPLEDIKESNSWVKVEKKYQLTEIPIEEIQNEKVTSIEVKLAPLDIVKHDDGVPVQSKPPLKLEDGSVYEGEWNKLGQKHGKGTLITEDGSKSTGIFKNGDLEGPGRIIQSTGLVLEGEFKQGKLNGEGKIKGKHGETFEGNLRNGNLHGFGVETWPDGMKYEGEYNNGQREGKGKLVLGDGSTYEGDFFKDKMEGQGVYTWKTGNKYTGEWKNSKMNGKGVFQWEDGRKYEGEFKDDLKNGYGKMVWPDGRYHEGTWLDGKQHGKGTYNYSKGDKFIARKGNWENGSRVSWDN